MSAPTSWMTKYGRRRVRHEPPTIDEALAAAAGMSDDRAEQIELAAELMQVPVEEVRAEADRLTATRPRLKASNVQIMQARGTVSAVVVERKPQRKFVSTAASARAGLRRPA